MIDTILLRYSTALGQLVDAEGKGIGVCITRRSYEPSPEHDGRYYVEQQGFWWWVVRCGTGTRTLFKAHTKTAALEIVAELRTAFLDGEFVGQGMLAAARPDLSAATVKNCGEENGV